MAFDGFICIFFFFFDYMFYISLQFNINDLSGEYT